MRDKIYPIFLPISEAPIQRTVRSRHSCAEASEGKHYAEATRDDSERMRIAECGMRNDPARIPRLPWWHAINWAVVVDISCIVALIGCLVYLGIFVYAPFALRFIYE